MKMSDLDNIGPCEMRAYTRMYGHFYPGDFPVGSPIASSRGYGTVEWSYHSPWRGMMYVVGRTWAATIEVPAHAVWVPIEEG